MDIVSRLKLFMNNAGISSSQFADTCDIPRPTLSQLLNGRNKKVSDEVIGKIHRAYPSLNVMWLMFGDGEMLLNGSNAQANNDKMSVSQSGAESLPDDMGQHRSITFDDDQPNGYGSSSKPAQRVQSSAPMSETLRTFMRNTAGRVPSRGGDASDPRRVINIVVFYSDGRFDEFSPANK